MPHGTPSYVVPKSGCRLRVAPHEAMRFAEFGSTGSPEMSRFHALSGGNTLRAGSGAFGGSESAGGSSGPSPGPLDGRREQRPRAIVVMMTRPRRATMSHPRSRRQPCRRRMRRASATVRHCGGRRTDSPVTAHLCAASRVVRSRRRNMPSRAAQSSSAWSRHGGAVGRQDRSRFSREDSWVPLDIVLCFSTCCSRGMGACMPNARSFPSAGPGERLVVANGDVERRVAQGSTRPFPAPRGMPPLVP